MATVEKLTGVHIDHFAEVNLDGFYELAKVLGGVEVCLRHAVYDPNSGADFRAGYQHLDAAQALAFVRQRDGLPNGDLDRTHRQQAFLDSVMHQLRTEGVLSDLTKVQALLSVAKQYVITDAGWNLLDFAAQMRSLTSGNLIFRTLPIQGYATIDGQDANVVSPAYIKAIVHATFYPPPGPPQPAQPAAARHRATARSTVDVLNGGDTTGLAGRVSAALASERVPGRPGREHELPRCHDGQLRAGRVGERQPDRGHVRRHRHGERIGRRRARRDPARRQRHDAADQRIRHAASPAVVVPSTGPQGGAVSAQERHSLRELTPAGDASRA